MELRTKSYAKIASLLILTILSLEIGFGLYSPIEKSSNANNPKEIDNSKPLSSDNQPYGISKFGYQIEGPDYIQRRVNQTSNTNILYRAYSYFGNIKNDVFNSYIIRFRNYSSNKISISYDGSFEIDISDFLDLAGVYNLSLEVYHRDLNFIYTKQITLNITDGINFDIYYPNLILWQTFNSYDDFSLKANTQNNTNINYRVYVNDIIRINENKSNSENVYWDLTKLGVNINNQNVKGEYRIQFNAIDLTNGSIAQYNSTLFIISENKPRIDKMDLSCYEPYRVGLSENRTINSKFSHVDSNTQLDAAYLVDLNNGIILQKFENLSKNRDYNFTINPFSELYENLLTLYPYNHEFSVKLVVVDEFGQSINYNQELKIKFPSISMDQKVKPINQFLNLTTSLTSFAYNFSETFERDGSKQTFSDLTYRITIAGKSTQNQKIWILFGTAQQFSRIGYLPNNEGDIPNDQYFYDGKEWNDYQIFYNQEYEIDNYNEKFLAGILFSIISENPEKIIWPIKIKLEYPEWLSPNTDYDEASLKLLKLNEKCGKFNFEQISETNITSAGLRTVIFNIYQPGYYAYGKLSEEYGMNTDQKIGGFPIFEIIGLMGISFAILIRKTQKRR